MVTAAARVAARRRMSLAEWADLPEDVEGELVDGVLIEEETPSALHELIVGWLNVLFWTWGTPKGAIVLGSDAKYGIARWRGRKPDLVVFLPGDPRPPMLGLIQVPPSIAVEVLSPSPRDQRRDRIDKVEDYARFGIRWYWILDPQLRSVQIHELDREGRYAVAIGASGGVIKRVPGCKGLQVDLTALWAAVDRAFPPARQKHRSRASTRFEDFKPVRRKRGTSLASHVVRDRR